MEPGLLSRIRSFISDPKSGDFDQLAMELFRRHFELNPPYRRFVEQSIASADSAVSWRDIPAAPAQAFKLFDLSCVTTERTTAVFHSSGTTQSLAGKHWMDSDALDLYRLSLKAGWENLVPQLDAALWAVMPSPTISPNSSLSYMLHCLGVERWFWDDWQSLSTALATVEGPVIVFGTGFSLVSMFDCCPASMWPLAPGSLIINTGGFKGRTRDVERGEFYQAMRARFGILDSACVSEYGMSEMASQFWAMGEDGPYKAPHWLRWRIIDPDTGTDVGVGQAGLLRVFDLANWNSVLAIQTQDLAIEVDGGFRLLGRAPDAEARGCSLTVEELWTRQ